jgi:hypothetical protein
MNHDADRIPVPTNGKGPQPLHGPPPDIPEPEATTVVFTPTQLAVGFGILASLVLLLFGRMRRRGRPGPRGRFGRR